MGQNQNITPGQIKYIQVLRRRVFGADEAGYREMLAAQAGRAAVNSCKDLRGPEIDLVIKHLERCAGKPPPPNCGQVTAEGGGATEDRRPQTENRLFSPAITHRQIWKIRDLWRQVSTAHSADREKALVNFLQRLTGKRKLEWLTLAEGSRVIEAMDAMLRRGRDTERGRHGDTGREGYTDESQIPDKGNRY